MPDKGSKQVKIAKKGTLAGELLGILGDTWITGRKTEVVYDLLQQRVTHKRTEGRPTGQQIDNAMKEINRPLNKRGMRTIKLIKTGGEMRGSYKFMLDVRLPETLVVSPKSPKPTTGKKKLRNTKI